MRTLIREAGDKATSGRGDKGDTEKTGASALPFFGVFFAGFAPLRSGSAVVSARRAGGRAGGRLFPFGRGVGQGRELVLVGEGRATRS